jgi:hypothetical protein
MNSSFWRNQNQSVPNPAHAAPANFNFVPPSLARNVIQGYVPAPAHAAPANFNFVPPSLARNVIQGYVPAPAQPDPIRNAASLDNSFWNKPVESYPGEQQAILNSFPQPGSYSSKSSILDEELSRQFMKGSNELLAKRNVNSELALSRLPQASGSDFFKKL